MQDLGPGGDLDRTVNTLLRGDRHALDAVVKRCFTDDATFDHPLLVLKGRNQIFQLYRYWNTLCTKDLRIHINERVISSKGDKVVLHLTEWITPQLWPSGLLAPPYLHLVTILYLVDTPRGKVICRQVDHPLWLESLVYQLPVVGRLWKEGWRRLLAAAIVNLYPAVDQWLAAP